METETQFGQGPALLRAHLLVLPEDVPPFLALLLILRYVQVRPWLCVKCSEILYAEFPHQSDALFSSVDRRGDPPNKMVSIHLPPAYTRHAALVQS